jgi:hypothetical protein
MDDYLRERSRRSSFISLLGIDLRASVFSDKACGFNPNMITIVKHYVLARLKGKE